MKQEKHLIVVLLCVDVKAVLFKDRSCRNVDLEEGNKDPTEVKFESVRLGSKSYLENIVCISVNTVI